MGIGPSGQASYSAISTYNALVPREGPKQIPYTLPFNGSGQTITIDLSQTIQLGIISVVQSLYMDLSACSAPVTVNVINAQQSITLPAGYQGFFPVLSSNPAKFAFTSVSNGSAHVNFVNVPIPADIWPTVGQALAITSPLAPSAGGPVQPLAVAQLGGIAAWSSYSNTTSAAASTMLFPAVAAGLRFMVQISAPSTVGLWVNRLGGTAGPGLTDCFQVPPGAVYTSTPGESVWQEWTYYCATGGLPYTALVQAAN
jgi:hypothetical protein